MKTRMQVAGVEFSAIHTFQTSQTKHTHTHTLLSFLFPLLLKGDLQGGRKHSEAAAFCSRILLHEGGEYVLFMGQHSVAIKALIRTVFCSQPGMTPLFLRFGSHRRSKQEEKERSGECGNVSTSSPRRAAPKHGFKLGEKKTQAKKRQALNYIPAC